MEEKVNAFNEQDEDFEGLLHWKKIGGGSLRLPNRIIKPNEAFWARREDIPEAFMKSLVLLDDSPQPRVRRRKMKEEPTYELKEKGGGWYDIVNSIGKKVNERSLRLDEANKLLESL